MNVSFERTRSLWMSQEVAAAPKLREDVRCDTVIVGSGIAGLSVAYELTAVGQSVVVLDRGPLAGGMTSRTTAHLAPICDDGVSELEKLRGEEMARLFQESQAAAVDRIEAIVNHHNISCNFRRLDAFLFPAMGMDTKDAKEQQDKEFQAVRKTGTQVERYRGVPLKGFEDAPVLRYPDQATFHPLKYINGLIAAIEKTGGKLFQDSPVTKIEEHDNSVMVGTDAGTVTATYAVFATNSPINDRVALHSKMAPYRTYAMAFTMPRGALPDALYWDMADPYHYVRLNPGRGKVDYLIAGGGDHKSGEADDGDVRFEAVEAWIRQLVPDLGKEVARWSGQVMDTIDYCGFIGLNPDSKNVYVVTGDSGQGMTHGALSGILVRDLIIAGSSPWREVYEPSRKPASGAINYVKENITAIQNFAEYLMPAEIESVDELKPGEGAVIRNGTKKVAASRGRNGKLNLVSAVCAGLVFGREAAENAISAQLSGLMGQQTAAVMQSAVASAADTSSGVWATLIGIATLIATASGVFFEMQSSLNAIWKTRPHGTTVSRLIQARAISLGLVAALGFLLIVSLAVSAGLTAFVDYLDAMMPVGTLILPVLNFIVSLALLAILFAAIYKVLPDRRLHWRDVIVGAVVTAVLFTIGKSLIGWYLGSSAVASSYGAAGGLIVLLLWVYYSVQIFLLGAEFTKIFANRHGSKRDKPI